MNRNRKQTVSDRTEAGNFWTSYSDLLTAVSVIFLVLFMFATLRAGVTQVQATKNRFEQEEYLRGKIPEKEAIKQADQLSVIKGSIKDMMAEKASIGVTMQEMKQYAETIRSRQSVIEDIFKDYKTKVAILEKSNETIRAYETANKKLQAERDSQSKELGELKTQNTTMQASLDTFQKKQAVQEDQIAKLSSDAQSKGQMLVSANQELERINGMLQNAKIESASLRTALDKEKGGYSDLKTQYGGLNEKYTNLKGQYDSQGTSLKSAGDKITDLEGKLGGLNGQLKAAGDENAALRGGLAQYKTKYDQANQGLSSLAGQLEAANKKIARISIARRQIASDIRDTLQKSGIDAETDPVSGTLTLRMDESFTFKNNSFELSEQAQDKLKKIIPIYANKLFGTEQNSKKINSVSITGYASPRYKRVYVDPNGKDDEAYRYNLQLSMSRAEQIAEFIFGKGIGPYAQKQRLKEKTHVAGKSFMEPIAVKAGEHPKEACGPYDCGKSRRVEIKFFLNEYS